MYSLEAYPLTSIQNSLIEHIFPNPSSKFENNNRKRSHRLRVTLLENN